MAMDRIAFQCLMEDRGLTAAETYYRGAEAHERRVVGRVVALVLASVFWLVPDSWSPSLGMLGRVVFSAFTFFVTWFDGEE